MAMAAMRQTSLYLAKRLKTLENHNINISTNSISKSILKKIEGNNTKSLVDICDFSLGLTPYDNG